jgi:hypothetical protein
MGSLLALVLGLSPLAGDDVSGRGIGAPGRGSDATASWPTGGDLKDDPGRSLFESKIVAVPNGGAQVWTDGGPLPVGSCLRDDGDSVGRTQRLLDDGCTVWATYGPAPWLTAHDYEAGQEWKDIPEGGEFTLEAVTYVVESRVHTAAPQGDVELSDYIYGDLTLQTCEADGLLFLHAEEVPAAVP